MTSRLRADIGEAAAAARNAAVEAPFFWVTPGTPPRVRGLAAHTATASPLGDSFVSWRWDGRTLVVRNDAFGMIPLFIYRRGGTLAISTSIQKLLHEGGTVHVDGAALAVFLRIGFFIADDTAFREIRALPPGATLVWNDGACTISGGPYLVETSGMTRTAAIDRAIELTAAAVDRRAPSGPFVLPLSGGRDSRHILLALLARGHRPEFTVTVPRFPPSAAEDERIAPLVADAVRVRHVLVGPTSSPATAEARKNVETHYCADEHAWFYPMLDYVRANATAVYEGIGGSLWTVGWLAARDDRGLWRQRRHRDVAARMLDRYSGVDDAFLDDLVPGHIAAGRDVALDRLADEIARHADAPDPGKSFHFWNRLRRELALVPFDCMRQCGDVHTPLVDRDLVDFLLSLPPEIMSSRVSRSDISFHSDAIARAYPHAAHIPFEADDAPHTDASLHNRALTVPVARHLLARVRPFRLMRSTYVMPRLAYTLASTAYAATSRWLATNALYLSQLEDAVAA